MRDGDVPSRYKLPPRTKDLVGIQHLKDRALSAGQASLVISAHPLAF